MIVHPIPPVFDGNSVVLILGSFPSVKSREAGFFYGHPRNRFWRVIARVCCVGTVPVTTEEKKAFLLSNRIALWDVIASCEIRGSSDTSIRNAVPNDISSILAAADVRAVFCNGTKAYALYNKYLYPQTGRAAVLLPSTSPANAQLSEDALTALWREAICPYLT